MAAELWAICLVLLGVFVGSFGPIFLKKSSDKFNLNPKEQIRNKNLIYGILCYAFGTIVFIPALKGGELSLLYPLTSLSYICVTFYSVKFLNEKINKYKLMGVLLIILGVSLIGIGS